MIFFSFGFECIAGQYDNQTSSDTCIQKLTPYQITKDERGFKKPKLEHEIRHLTFLTFQLRNEFN